MAEQTLANATARAREHGFQANRAFIVESLVLLAFLALAVALILQMFAQAALASRSAHAQSMAVQLAGNAAERFAAMPAASVDTVFYDDAGRQVSDSSPDAAWRVSVDVEGVPADAGVLYEAEVLVEPLVASTTHSSYSLNTARYVSDEGVQQ